MTPEQARELSRVTVKTEAMEDSRDAAGLKNLKISGYMDPTFIWNKAQNRAGAQFLNKVESDLYNYDNSYFGAAVIDFQKETDSGTRWRLTLAPNRGVGSVFDSNSPVHEASVSVPLTDLQTRLLVGQLPDWSGYEYLQPTLNKLITHNLLFDFTLPTAYTGVGTEITRGKWIVKAMLGNMNKSMKDAGNKTPMLAYRVDYSRGEYQGFGFAGVHGKAVNFNEDINGDGSVYGESRVNLFEVDGYFIRGDWTVQGQLSYGPAKARRRSRPTRSPASLRDAKLVGPVGPGGLQVQRRDSKARCGPTTSTTTRTAAACSATTCPTPATASAPAPPSVARRQWPTRSRWSTPAAAAANRSALSVRPVVPVRPEHHLQGGIPARPGQRSRCSLNVKDGTWQQEQPVARRFGAGELLTGGAMASAADRLACARRRGA